MKKAFILIVLSLPFFYSCDSGSGDDTIFLNGRILNFVDLGSVEIEVIENDNTKDSTEIDGNGNFSLNFDSSSGRVTLRFIGEQLTVERQNFSVTDDSTIELDVTIQLNPVSLVFDRWVVFQDRISLSDDDDIMFSEAQAEIIINGEEQTCIRARDESVVEFRVKSIDLSNCDEGVSSQNSSRVILLADEAITIISQDNGIRARDESSVNIGETMNPVDNSVEVRSFEADGVQASGSATVTFTPQNNNCTIRGADDAVNERESSVIDTDGCILVEG